MHFSIDRPVRKLVLMEPLGMVTMAVASSLAHGALQPLVADPAPLAPVTTIELIIFPIYAAWLPSFAAISAASSLADVL
jgi:hypothetical protein